MRLGGSEFRTERTSAPGRGRVSCGSIPGQASAADRCFLGDGPAPASTEADSSAPALARAQALLQAASRTSADALLVTDDAGRAETGNLRFLALFGLFRQSSRRWRRRHWSAASPAVAASRGGRDPDRIGAGLGRGSGRLIRARRRKALRALLQRVSLAGLAAIWRYREIAAAADAAVPTPAAEATRALRLKDEFIANLSHALRTPLGAVLGWSKAAAA